MSCPQLSPQPPTSDTSATDEPLKEWGFSTRIALGFLHPALLSLANGAIHPCLATSGRCAIISSRNQWLLPAGMKERNEEGGAGVAANGFQLVGPSLLL